MEQYSELGALGDGQPTEITYDHISRDRPATTRSAEVTILPDTKMENKDKKGINWLLVLVIVFSLVIVALQVTTLLILSREGSKNVPKTEAQKDLGKDDQKELIKTMKNILEQCNKEEPKLKDKNTTLGEDVARLLSYVGWHQAENGFLYKLFTEKVDYVTAQHRCEVHNAKLAARGMRENSTRNEIFDKLIAPEKENTWIGLDDRNEEGVFVWSDGIISNKNNTKWAKGQPDEGYLSDEDCGHLWKTQWDGSLNDASCGSKYYFICESKYDNQ